MLGRGAEVQSACLVVNCTVCIAFILRERLFGYLRNDLLEILSVFTEAGLHKTTWKIIRLQFFSYRYLLLSPMYQNKTVPYFVLHIIHSFVPSSR